MKRHYLTIFILFSILQLFSNSIRAENDQTLVFDLGFGFQFFNEADEFRDANTFVNNISWIGHAGAELYLFDFMGIGVKQLNIYGASDHLELRKEYAIQNSVATLNFVPFGSDRYARIILVVGLGKGKYNARELWEDDHDSSNNYDYTGYVEGPVTLGQILADWGGDAWGLRAGVSYLLTDFDDLELGPKTYEINGSGWGFCALSVRYAF